MQTPAGAVYQFGQFEVKAASGELFRMETVVVSYPRVSPVCLDFHLLPPCGSIFDGLSLRTSLRHCKPGCHRIGGKRHPILARRSFSLPHRVPVVLLFGDCALVLHPISPFVIRLGRLDGCAFP